MSKIDRFAAMGTAAASSRRSTEVSTSARTATVAATKTRVTVDFERSEHRALRDACQAAGDLLGRGEGRLLGDLIRAAMSVVMDDDKLFTQVVDRMRRRSS